MKIVLAAINAKYIHSNMAVYSLKACGERVCDGDISIAEFTINNYIDDILPRLYKERPDVLAFSCYIWNISMVEELAELIHKAAPWVNLWLGGPEVSYDAEDVLTRNPAVKLVMCGEGEDTFSQLAAKACDNGATLSDEDLEKIAGIVFRASDGRLRRTAPRPAVDMDTLPFPYESMELFKNKIIYYESSRGCPFSCSYCLSSIDKQVRFRSLALVKKELKFFLDHRVPQVKFVDRTFNCRHDRTLELWRFIRDHDNGITNFHFEITADLLNEEELELLSTLRPGLVQLEIGVQSTNERTIREIDRRVDFDKLSEIVRRIRQGGNVHQHLDLIAGLPYEGLESFKKSFNDVYALKPQQLQMGFLKVLKGSKMHRVSDSYDLVYRSKPVYEVISTRWLSFEEILTLKGIEEMVEVYYNSSQFRLSLEYLEHFFAAPFDLFLAMAEDYERRGLDGGRYSRLERYDQLREFTNRMLPADDFAPAFCAPLFDEILLYDLYLRENVKSRPDWASNTGSYKEAVAEFYSSPQMRERYFKDEAQLSYRQLRHQTHVEPFHWDIPQSAAAGRPVGGSFEAPGGKAAGELAVTVYKNVPAGAAVLFDYSRRDPLTYEARTVVLEDIFNG